MGDPRVDTGAWGQECMPWAVGGGGGFLPLWPCSVTLGTFLKGGRGTHPPHRALRRMKRHAESGRHPRAGCFLGTTLALERWMTSPGPQLPSWKMGPDPRPLPPPTHPGAQISVSLRRIRM